MGSVPKLLKFKKLGLDDLDVFNRIRTLPPTASPTKLSPSAVETKANVGLNSHVSDTDNRGHQELKQG